MNIEASVVEEHTPNYQTRKAIEDDHQKKGRKVKNAQELFTKLGI